MGPQADVTFEGTAGTGGLISELRGQYPALKGRTSDLVSISDLVPTVSGLGKLIPCFG